jgi:hypothetical protein
MKNLLFLFFLAISAVAVQAQSDNLTSTTSVNDEVAAKAASMDATIDRRVCETSGKVSYYRKDVCEKSGKVAFEQVHFDAAAGQFVNVAPSSIATGEKAACASKTAGKACCASKGTSATAASSEEKAACASGSKTAGKACCSSKKAKGASAAVNEDAMPQGSGAKKVNN